MEREPTHISMDGHITGNTVQADSIHGSVQFHQHEYRSGRQPVELPYRAGGIPSRAGSFQDRATTELVAAALASGDAAVLTSDGPPTTRVLSGLGGVGKTQLAVDHAETAWSNKDVDLLVWVTAGSREAIVSTYARVAADLVGVEHADPDQGARRFVDWLANTQSRWLVVLDDLQSPGDLTGLWPPVTPHGQVLVTTRRRDAALHGHGRRMIEVGAFTPAEAHRYLQATLAGHSQLLDGADLVASEVGFLPLALAQAAAFVIDRQISCAEYGTRFADRRRSLATLFPDPEGLPDEHRVTVAATWSISTELANRLAPAGLAGPLLEIASFLDANGFPFEVFRTKAVLGFLASRIGRAVDAEEARDGVACLHRLSLVTWRPTAFPRSVRVHALVQRATRDALSEEQASTAVWTAADALFEIWPEIERDASVGHVFRANAEALSTTGDTYLWRAAAHEVLLRAGHSLGASGQVNQAAEYFLRLCADTERHLGAEHVDTFCVRSSVARWRGHAGDPAGAAAALEELLPDQSRALGADHPHTLTIRNNLGYWWMEAGDPARAAAAFEELLIDRLRVLGAEHPHTLMTRSNLARSQGEAGDPAEAVTAFEELLADRSRVLGADHLDTLATRNNLARWRGEAGDPAGAAAALEELLTDQLRVLGADHPHTLITRNNLARWRGEAGDPAGAAAALEELLTDQLRVLGAHHPHTRITRNDLAHWTAQASGSEAT